MRKRRYEILLPLKLNDGEVVSDEVLDRTREDLLERFDGISVVPQSVVGVWKHEGHRYEEHLAKFVIDVDDTEENQIFFAEFKSRLLERFRQIEIYMVSFPIDRV